MVATEVDLLLACLGPAERAGEIPAAAGPEAWLGLAALAGAKRCGPWVWSRLRERGWDELAPPEARAALAESYRANALRNVQLAGRLYGVLGDLAARGIPVIVLKGIDLAENIYPDRATRVMLDVDLLVPPEAVDEAAAVLAGRGFAPERPYTTGDERSHMHHLPRFMAGDYGVEVHWQLVLPTEPYAVETAGLWARARPVRVANRQVLGLALEDLLVHLCLHGANQHQFQQGPRMLIDLDLLLRRHGEALDWGAVAERSRRIGCGRGVLLSLALARAICGAPVPDDALARLGAVAQAPLELATQQIFARPEAVVAMPENLALLRARPALTERAGHIWRRLFPSPHYVARQYRVSARSPLLPLVYLRRIGALARQYGASAWGLLRTDPAVVADAERVDRLTTWLAGEGR